MKEALDVYKRIRQDIKTALPFWPLGLPKFNDPWLALGLRAGNKSYLAVWRLAGEPTCRIPLRANKAELLYPAGGECKLAVEAGTLSITLPKINTARLFAIM